jgi:hypothetical protein
VKDQALQPDTAARQRAIDAALSQMDKQFGKGSVLRLGSRNVLPVTVIPAARFRSTRRWGSADFRVDEWWTYSGRSHRGRLRWRCK